MAPIGWHRLITGPLARVGSVFSILHAESVINRRVWITYTAILCGLLALHVPFLIETRPFFAILVATLMADLAGGVFHIYCDHTAIRNDGSLLDDQRKGFQWHHENPSGKFEDPAYEPHYEMNYVYPYAILGTLASFALPGQFRAFAVFFSAFSVLQQASHLWCHARLSGQGVPLLVAWLQDARILLHPRAHEKHHTDPNFDGNFCIFTGHTNALVNVGWLAVRMWQGAGAITQSTRPLLSGRRSPFPYWDTGNWIDCGALPENRSREYERIRPAHRAGKETKITDSGLEPLAKLANLQSLDREATKSTAASVAKLQKVLPNCNIECDTVPSASPAEKGANRRRQSLLLRAASSSHSRLRRLVSH